VILETERCGFMGLISNLFKSKEKRLKAQKYKLGLNKTSSGVFNNLKFLLESSKAIDDDLFDELEELFIMADIGVDTVLKFVEHLRATVSALNLSSPLELKEVIVEEMFKLYVKDEIVSSNLDIRDDRLNIVLFVGVNGAGKTTTIGKIANEYIKKGKKVLLVAGDTFRAGAISQLKIWSDRVNSSFFSKEEGSDPSSVMYDAIKYAQENNVDVILCDTAGRLQNKVNLMRELEKINKVIGRECEGAPHETLLVVDATTGQNGLSQAKIFNDVTNITGVVLTKLDGTAKGGIVLAIKDELDIPIKYVGLGEKIDDLEHFDIEEYIYGMFSGIF
jgi:fused signal recognition particle receptor